MAALPPDADFFDHLELLRRYLIAGGALFLAVGVATFFWAEPVISLLTAPAERLSLPLYVLRPQEKLLAYLRVALSAALLVGLPATIALLARFIAPALDRSGRRRLAGLLAALLGLFAGGTAFALLVVIPSVIAFFARFGAGDGIAPLWSFGEYLRSVTLLLFAFPLVFESPIVLLLLVRSGLLPLDTLRRYRRHAVIVILLLSAVITPPDLISQILLAVPLLLLYEGTILVARVAGWSRRGAVAQESGRWTDGSS